MDSKASHEAAMKEAVSHDFKALNEAIRKGDVEKAHEISNKTKEDFTEIVSTGTSEVQNGQNASNASVQASPRLEGASSDTVTGNTELVDHFSPLKACNVTEGEPEAMLRKLHACAEKLEQLSKDSEASQIESRRTNAELGAALRQALLDLHTAKHDSVVQKVIKMDQGKALKFLLGKISRGSADEEKLRGSGAAAAQ